MNVTVTLAIMPALAWTSPMVIPATAHTAGWEQTVKSVRITAAQPLAFNLTFSVTKTRMLTGPSQPHATHTWGSEAPEITWITLSSKSQCRSFARCILPPLLLPESEFSLSTGMRMCRCHPEFSAATTAKNVLNRETLESYHQVESLCWKRKKTHQM